MNLHLPVEERGIKKKLLVQKWKTDNQCHNYINQEIFSITSEKNKMNVLVEMLLKNSDLHSLSICEWKF